MRLPSAGADPARADAPQARRALVLALLLAALPTWTLWLQGRVVSGRDMQRIFRPAAHALQARLERGQLPEWEPAVLCGQPLVGLGQSQALYPPRWAQVLLGPERTLSLLAVLHPLLAALGGFLLARRLGRSPEGALVAALSCGAAPTLLASFDAPNMEYAAAWAPWALLAAERLGQAPREGVWLGAALALQVLAGSVELAAGTGLCAAAWALGGVGPRRRALAGLALGAVVGALLCAPEVLALAEHGREGPRSQGLSLAEASHWSLGWSDLAGLLLPLSPPADASLADYRERQALLTTVYLGLAGLLLALVALLRGERRWAAPAGLALLLALGRQGGVFALLHLLPGLDRLRFPVKFALLLAPLLALGAAAGLEALESVERRLGAGPALLALVAAWAHAWAAVPGLVVLALAVGRPGRGRALGALAVALDLGAAAWVLPVVPTEPAADPAHLAAQVPDPGPRYRLGVRLTDEDWFHLGQQPEAAPDEVDAFTPNFPQTAGVRLASGYGPNLSVRAEQLARRGGAGAQALLGERLTVALRTRARPGWQEQATLGEVGVFAHEALPRGLFFTRWRVLSPADARARILAHDFDPRAEALLESEPGLPAPAPGAAPAMLEPGLSESRPEEVELTVDAPAPGVAVLQDSWDPGWSAEVDGQPAPVLRAEYAFLGVPVTRPGPHRVLLRYRSRPLRWGLGLQALGLLIGVLVGRSGRRRA